MGWHLYARPSGLFHQLFNQFPFLFPLQRSRQTKQAVSGRTSEEICQAVWRTSSSDSNPRSVPKVSNKSGKKKKKVVWILSATWTRDGEQIERGEWAKVRFYHLTVCLKRGYNDLFKKKDKTWGVGAAMRECVCVCDILIWNIMSCSGVRCQRPLIGKRSHNEPHAGSNWNSTVSGAKPRCSRARQTLLYSLPPPPFFFFFFLESNPLSNCAFLDVLGFWLKKEGKKTRITRLPTPCRGARRSDSPTAPRFDRRLLN